MMMSPCAFSITSHMGIVAGTIFIIVQIFGPVRSIRGPTGRIPPAGVLEFVSDYSLRDYERILTQPLVIDLTRLFQMWRRPLTPQSGTMAWTACQAL